jgi:hypothetical protein
MTYEGKVMKVMKKQSVKIVKRKQRPGSELLTKIVFVPSHKKWSRAIRSWVDDSRQRTERESFRKFDSLFKQASGVDFHDGLTSVVVPESD